MTLITRKPTGKPPWPILLLAGAEKSGKSYAAAEASASDLIGRTLWLSVGEDDPDEYGALPGARFELVQHDGSYRGILTALTEASAEKADKPNLLVLDSATRLWDLLCDDAQATANDRAARKARKENRAAPDDDVQITMDLWNTAKQRWGHVIDVLRDHVGPSIVTARLEQVTVLDSGGNPTKEKSWKVKAEKSLPYDVGAIVEMPVRGEVYLTGVRSLKFRAEPSERVQYMDFTVERLWTDLGLAEPDATAPRRHTPAKRDDGTNPNIPLINEIAELADKAGVGKEKVLVDWAEAHDGQHIKDATDVGSLELLRDDLRTRTEAA